MIGEYSGLFKQTLMRKYFKSPITFPRSEVKGNYKTLSVTQALPYKQTQERHYKQRRLETTT